MKIMLAIGTVALIVVSAMVWTGLHFLRQQLLEEFQIFVRSVAGTTALALSGDGLRAIRTNDDADTPQFEQARTVLEQARQINGLTEREIYVLRPLDAAGETEFVVMLQRPTFIGDHYTIRDENKPRLMAAWSQGEPASTGMYRDEHGRWISGYARVADRAGQPVAIIEVDAEISRFLARERGIVLLSVSIGAGALALGIIPGWILAANITRGLNRLSDGMRRFQAGDHDVQVETGSGDEVAQLGRTFNEMIVSLGEKLALLPYVSRFTSEAVQRSRNDPSWLTGSEQEVLVLFADLRGFTRYSEQRDATVLVRQLNQLLALQADVVISAGGDVDKFIGDAVMTVFLDRTDTADQVYACSRQLVEKLRGEVAAHGWPLAVGVGINRGRAVVGSIGSETRRDFTAIGHTVNLAARLCDRAEPWQILVSEAFYMTLPAGS